MNMMLFCADRHGAHDVLKLMIDKGVNVVGCVFDEGRPNYLCELCRVNNIPTYTTVEMYEALQDGNLPCFDVGISYLYPKLLRESIIKFAPQGIINFHPAPVSEHKGIAACCYCLYHDFQKWAVTAHYVSSKFDDGDVIEEYWFPMNCSQGRVTSAISAEQFIQKKALLLFELILEKLKAGEKLTCHKQDLESGTYFSRKDLEQMKDVTGIHDTNEIDKRIRSLWFPPYHGASVQIGGKRYSLVSSEILAEIAELYEKNMT